MKDDVGRLTLKQNLDPAKHHFRSSSVHRFPTKPAKSKRSLQSHELRKYRGYRNIPQTICSPKLDGLFHLPCLFITHRATKGSLLQQIKEII